jgi:DNA-binding response OmpR family regulator
MGGRRLMPYESQTREQILEAEVELLQYRLDELLGTKLVRPIRKMELASFRVVNVLAKRAPCMVAHENLHHAFTDRAHELKNPHNSLKVHIARARHLLEPHDIEICLEWGRGYYMPAESARKWQALVEAANPTPHNLEDAAA